MRLFLLLSMTLFLSPAFATEGSGVRGGGDSLSSRIKTIRGWLGEDGALGRRSVRRTLENLQKLRWDHPMGQKLARLLETSDLLGDVDHAPYRLEPRCRDTDEVERSASTELVDRKQNPAIAPPAICINVRKLAAENATFAEVMGTLVHEHLRHFGEPDVDHLEAHPSAEFIAENFGILGNYELSQASSILSGVALYRENARAFTLLVRTRAEARSIGLIVETLEGKCGPAYVIYERSHYLSDGSDRGTYFSSSDDLIIGQKYALWDQRRERQMDRESSTVNFQRMRLRVDEFNFLGLIQSRATECSATLRLTQGDVAALLDSPVNFADSITIQLYVFVPPILPAR